VLAPADGPPASPQPTPQQPGEGIGLSIVKRLCELLDASMEMTSSAETGTTFRIVLPRRYQSDAPGRVSPHSDARRRGV
jgi:signal transduction histidine kinase